jgi:hypothetical protein
VRHFRLLETHILKKRSKSDPDDEGFGNKAFSFLLSSFSRIKNTFIYGEKLIFDGGNDMKKIREICWGILAILCMIVLFPIVILWFVFQVAFMWLMERLGDILWKLDYEEVHTRYDTLADLMSDSHDSIKEIFLDMKLEL